MALRIFNKDNFVFVTALNKLYTVKPNIGIEVETHIVNNISEREIKKMPVRDKIKLINIDTIDKSYIRGINGDIYDVDLIRGKKDNFSPIALKDEMDEFYIYNILSFDYNNITRERLEFLYDNLRKLSNNILKGKMAEVVLLQILCMDEEFLKIFLRVSAKSKKSGDILFKIIILESKNWDEYNPNEIRKLCRDAMFLVESAKASRNKKKKGKSSYVLEQDEIIYKFCLFVHFFEDPSGKNDMKFYYINPTNDINTEIYYSDSFDSNFKAPFLGIPFVTLDNKNDYLRCIKAYLSDMEKVIREYEYIIKMGKYYELIYCRPVMRKEMDRLREQNERQSNEITALNNTVSSLMQTIAARDQTIAAQEQAITNITQENASQAQTITKLRSDMSKIHALFDVLLSSEDVEVMSKLRALLNIPPSSENVEDISNS